MRLSSRPGWSVVGSYSSCAMGYACRVHEARCACAFSQFGHWSANPMRPQARSRGHPPRHRPPSLSATSFPLPFSSVVVPCQNAVRIEPGRTAAETRQISGRNTAEAIFGAKDFFWRRTRTRTATTLGRTKVEERERTSDVHAWQSVCGGRLCSCETRDASFCSVCSSREEEEEEFLATIVIPPRRPTP